MSFLSFNDKSNIYNNTNNNNNNIKIKNQKQPIQVSDLVRQGQLNDYSQYTNAQVQNNNAINNSTSFQNEYTILNATNINSASNIQNNEDSLLSQSTIIKKQQNEIRVKSNTNNFNSNSNYKNKEQSAAIHDISQLSDDKSLNNTILPAELQQGYYEQLPLQSQQQEKQKQTVLPPIKQVPYTNNHRYFKKGQSPQKQQYQQQQQQKQQQQQQQQQQKQQQQKQRQSLVIRGPAQERQRYQSPKSVVEERIIQQTKVILQKQQQMIQQNTLKQNDPVVQSLKGDSYSKYKLFKVMSSLLKGQGTIKMTVAPFTSKKQLITYQPVQYYQLKALEELDNLKNKFLKKNLDQIILNFLINKIEMCYDLIQFIGVSAKAQQVFYQNHKEIFQEMRQLLCSTEDITRNLDLLLADQIGQEEEEKKQQLNQLMELFFDHHIQVVNRVDLTGVMLKLQNVKLNGKEEAENPQKSNQLNMYTEVFSVFSTKMFYDKVFEKSQQLKKNTEYVNEKKFQKMISEAYKEKQKRGGRGGDGDEQSRPSTANSVDSVQLEIYTKEAEKVQYLYKHYRTPSNIFRFQSIIQFVEEFHQAKQLNYMTRALQLEIGHFHLIYRTCLTKYEMFLDLGLQQQQILKMNKRLDIAAEQSDLVWISVLYCLFLVKYSPNGSTNVLDALLQSNKGSSQYDDYFLYLTKFNKIKREFVMKKLEGAQKQFYLKYSSHVLLMNKEKQRLEWFQFYDMKAKQSFTQIDKNYKSKFLLLEKVTYSEVIEALIQEILENENMDLENILNQYDPQKELDDLVPTSKKPIQNAQ